MIAFLPNNEADYLRDKSCAAKTQLTHGLRGARTSLVELVNVKHLVVRYPIKTTLAALVLGFLFGEGIVHSKDISRGMRRRQAAKRRKAAV